MEEKEDKRRRERNDVILRENLKSNQIEISKHKSHQIRDLRDFRITSIFVRIEKGFERSIDVEIKSLGVPAGNASSNFYET